MNGPRDHSPLVLVVGSGRSGTSTLAGVLRRVGFVVPGEEVPVDDTNPKGFAEPRWVVELHGALLDRLGVQVADARPEVWTRVAVPPDRADLVATVRQQLRPWVSRGDGLVVKDPRLLWFLPIWAEATEGLVEASHVTVLRPLPEVVGSRRTSYNRDLTDAHGVAGWLNTMLHAEAATRGRRRAFVRYDDLLDDWARQVSRLDDALGLRLGPPSARARAEVDAFVDPGLRRVRLGWTDLDVPPRLLALAREATSAFETLRAEPASASAAATLDHVAADYRDYYAECAAVSRSSVIAAQPAPAPAAPISGREAAVALARAVGRRARSAAGASRRRPRPVA